MHSAHPHSDNAPALHTLAGGLADLRRQAALARGQLEEAAAGLWDAEDREQRAGHEACVRRMWDATPAPQRLGHEPAPPSSPLPYINHHLRMMRDLLGQVASACNHLEHAERAAQRVMCQVGAPGEGGGRQGAMGPCCLHALSWDLAVRFGVQHFTRLLQTAPSTQLPAPSPAPCSRPPARMATQTATTNTRGLCRSRWVGLGGPGVQRDWHQCVTSTPAAHGAPPLGGGG